MQGGNRHCFLFAVIFLITSIIFFHSIVGLDQFIATSDTFYLNYVLKRWHQLAWSQSGSFPLWNDFVFGGLYDPANPVLSRFSPLSFFYFLLDDQLAQSISIITLLSTSLFFSSLVAHRFVKDYSLALFCAIFYTFGGYQVSQLVNFPYFAGPALIPIVFYFGQNFFQKKNLSAVAPLVFANSWMFFEGDLNSFLIANILIVTLHSWNKKLFALYTFQAFLVSLIISIQILPTLEALEASRRSTGIELREVLRFSLHPKELIQLFIPNYYGSSFKGDFSGSHLLANDTKILSTRFWSEKLYIGILPIFVFLIGLLSIKNVKRNLKEYLLLFFFLLLSFGAFFPFYEFFYRYLPFFDTLRFPAKFFPAVSFLALLCVSKTLLYHEDRISEGKRKFLFIIPVLLFIELVINSPYLLTKPIDQVSKPSPLFMTNEQEMRKILVDQMSFRSQNLHLLKHNIKILEGDRYTLGYEPTIPKRYDLILGTELFEKLAPWSEVLGINYVYTSIKPRSSLLHKHFLDKFITIDQHFSDLNLIRLKTVSPSKYITLPSKIIKIPDDLKIFKEISSSRSMKETAFIREDLEVDQKNVDIKFINLSSNQKKIEVFNHSNIEKDILIQLKSNYHSGWKVKNKELIHRFFPVNIFNLGLFIESLPAKKTEILLEFKPKSFTFGFILFLTGIVLTLLLFLFSNRFTPKLQSDTV